MNSTDVSDKMKTAFIGLGANLQDPVSQVKTAIDEIASLPRTTLNHSSSLYRSAPMGPQDQDEYINAVVEISTSLEPIELLDNLQSIEKSHGRIRKAERWGPRTLDLDILLYNNSNIDHPRLTIPHYGMRERSFVLLPLLEINEQIKLPDGTSIAQLASNIERQGISKL